MTRLLAVGMAAVLSGLAGCAEAAKPAADEHAEVRPVPSTDEATIQAALARLDLTEQPLAQQQRYCPVHLTHRLGSLGTPLRVTLGDEVFFICSDGCQHQVEAAPAAMMQRARALRSRFGEPPVP